MNFSGGSQGNRTQRCSADSSLHGLQRRHVRQWDRLLALYHLHVSRSRLTRSLVRYILLETLLYLFYKLLANEKAKTVLGERTTNSHRYLFSKVLRPIKSKLLSRYDVYERLLYKLGLISEKVFELTEF